MTVIYSFALAMQPANYLPPAPPPPPRPPINLDFSCRVVGLKNKVGRIDGKIKETSEFLDEVRYADVSLKSRGVQFPKSLQFKSEITQPYRQMLVAQYDRYTLQFFLPSFLNGPDGSIIITKRFGTKNIPLDKYVISGLCKLNGDWRLRYK